MKTPSTPPASCSSMAPGVSQDVSSKDKALVKVDVACAGLPHLILIGVRRPRSHMHIHEWYCTNSTASLSSLAELT